MRDNGVVTQIEYPLPDGLTIVSRTDLQGNILEANEAFIEASGYDWLELVGQPHNILRHPDVPPAVFADFWHTLKSGKPWSQTVKNRRKNGDHYWVIANATPTFENGKMTGYMSVRTPATRQEIQAAERAYKAIAAGQLKLNQGVPAKAADKFNLLKNYDPTTLILALCVFGLSAAYIPHFFPNVSELLFGFIELITVLLIGYTSYYNGLRTQEMAKTITALSEGKFDNKIDSIGNNTVSKTIGRLKSMQIKLGADFEEIRDTLKTAKRVESALYSASSNIMVADRFRSIIFMNKSVKDMLREIEPDLQAVLPNFNVDHLMRKNIDIFHQNPAHQKDILDNLKETYKARIKIGPKTIDLIVDPIFDEAGVRIGTVAEWKNMTEQLAIEENIQEIVADASKGILKRRIDTQKLHGFEHSLSTSINALIDSFGNISKDLSSILTAMSDGDLTQRMTGIYEGDVLAMQTAINNALKNLGITLGHIKQGSSEIGNMSHEVSQASDDLSQRTQEQAASLEETAASMEELTATLTQSAENANQATQYAKEAADQASAGITVMNKTLSAMHGISDLSQKIGEITSVIDSIAFQTNLLALNAAVEAARAGEHGRGFAVVAGEVRSLAQKSAESSKEISNLISSATAQIKQGTVLVEETNKVFEVMVTQIRNVEGLVSQVSSTTQEQALGISQVNQAVTNLDQMTQQNAALVEELSATAGNMSEQATSQAQFVERFQIEDSAKRQISSGAGFATIDFEEAKMKHRSWNAKLEQLLNGYQTDINKQSARQKDACPLGKWLYGEGQKYAHMKDMQSLIKTHEEMHATVGKVLDAYDIKDLETARQEKEKVTQLSHKIITYIDLVKSQVVNDMRRS